MRGFARAQVLLADAQARRRRRAGSSRCTTSAPSASARKAPRPSAPSGRRAPAACRGPPSRPRRRGCTWHAALLRRRADLHHPRAVVGEDARAARGGPDRGEVEHGRRRRGLRVAGSRPRPVPLEVLRQAELAARDDVLLDLRGAAADRSRSPCAVGALEAARHRRVLCVDPQLPARPRMSRASLQTRWESCRREELVLGGLGRWAACRRSSPRTRSAAESALATAVSVTMWAICWRTCGSSLAAAGRRARRCFTYSTSSVVRSAIGESVNIVKRSRSRASEMYWKPLPRSPTR